MSNQEHERERDQTHSYWYIPSALRVNYSLLVMESAGMMKMATGEGFPLRKGVRMGRDWFLVATEACGGGTPDLGYVLWGARPGGRERPHPRRCLGTLLAHLRCSVGFFWSKNNPRQISGQLDSVWFSFSAILKNKEKTEAGTGL